MKNCAHEELTCLNQYDLIRKYHCEHCKEIMMCKCDKEHGQRFLPHQLSHGSRMGSSEKISVTLGFQKDVCPECRGEKPVAAPRAPMHGATTKITRYYWREIAFETTRRFHNIHSDLVASADYLSEFSFQNERKVIEKQVISEIKKVNSERPKYEYSELSQQEVTDLTKTEIILVNTEHININKRKVGIRNGEGISTVEKFAADYFEVKGYNAIETESVPFHVLFGVLMYLVIQDPDDEKGQVVQFGSRNDFDKGISEEGLITTILPEDFGSELYYNRQKELICWHLDQLENLDWLFEYWTETSSAFRQYLWAHREKDIDKARAVMKIIGLSNLRKILHYLSMNYWKNFCGWPDLIVYDDQEFFFVEVKSSNDKLSEDQKNWLLGNFEHMGFKSKIFKVGKK